MRLTAGLLTYDSGLYATRCLQTLMAQEELGLLNTDWQIVVLDNASNDRVGVVRLEKEFPEITFIKSEENLGFGKGHNEIMRRHPAEYHAVLNIDVLFMPNFLAELLALLGKHQRAGSAVGKLCRWDLNGDPEKTNIIDSVGIAATPAHAFYDIGQGEEDDGQYNYEAERFGGSGAAVLYRRKALEEAAYPGEEFFDETFFMYKEDVDLAYRLTCVNRTCWYTPKATAWHARTAAKDMKRSDRSAWERTYSAAHERLLLSKHKGWWPIGIRLQMCVRQCVRNLYLMLRERSVYRESKKTLASLKQKAGDRIAQTRHTVSYDAVSHLFHKA